MNELQTYVDLATALQAWFRDFEMEDYRLRRLSLWRSSGTDEPFRSSRDLDVRFIIDRKVSLYGELEAWLVDLWLLRKGDGLAHNLQVVVCPAGLERPPLPSAKQARPLRLQNRRGGENSLLMAFPSVVSGTENIRFQALVIQSRDSFKGRPGKGDAPGGLHTAVRINRWTRPQSVLAQILLVALRLGYAQQNAQDWLVSYAEKLLPSAQRIYAEDAVNRAVINYLYPVAGPERYIKTVALKLAISEAHGRGSAPQQEEAANLGVSLRTLYRWKADGLDPVVRADVFADKKYRTALAEHIAVRRGISSDAARMFLRRQLAKGKSLTEVFSETT